MYLYIFIVDNVNVTSLTWAENRSNMDWEKHNKYGNIKIGPRRPKISLEIYTIQPNPNRFTKAKTT